MKILIANSGGKDSQAAMLWAFEKYPKDQIEVVFCDTGWEHELTYKHLQYQQQYLGVKFTTLTNEKYPNGFVDLCKKKKRVPSPKARFCTEELKVMPIEQLIGLPIF